MRTYCCNHADTGSNMDQVIVQLILLIICLSFVDTAISKVYEANPDRYNTKSINKPLSIKQTDSILRCSALCVMDTTVSTLTYRRKLVFSINHAIPRI